METWRICIGGKSTVWATFQTTRERSPCIRRHTEPGET